MGAQETHHYYIPHLPSPLPSPLPHSDKDDIVVYLLQLEGGNYYVGKTRNLEKRLLDHYNGKGSEWTKLHPPSQHNPLEIYPYTSCVDEDYRVKQAMSKYGILNVRGGSYTSIQLPPEQLFALAKELMTALDLCYNCGNKGHYILNCKSKPNGYIYTPIPPSKCTKCGNIGHTTDICKSKRDIRLKCLACGKQGHSIETCYIGGWHT